jgi:hypothetical protein
MKRVIKLYILEARIKMKVAMLKLAKSIAEADSNPVEINEYIINYNNKIGKVPAIIRSLLGNERVNIKIAMTNGETRRIFYETRNARICNMAKGELKNPTISVTSTEEALKRIDASSDPTETFLRERRLGRIAIRGHNAVVSFKLDTALSNASVLRFFLEVFLS